MVIGIDLGLKGGIALLKNGKLFSVDPMPVTDILVGKKIKSNYDIYEIYAIIKRIVSDYEINMAVMERLRAMPNQMSQTSFSMGYGVGVFRTIFTILEIPYTEIEPRSWQKKVFGQLGISYNKDTTKEASKQAAKQLFPNIDFKRTSRCKTDSDGLTDSALIGYYLFCM